MLAVMLAAPMWPPVPCRGHSRSTARPVAAQCGACASHRCHVPLNPPHLMSQWLPTVVHGWTVGAGHYTQLEVPDQVNAMIEGFLRHHV